MGKKTIAVIMTAYNEQIEWFQKAIESVLNQTYRDIHLYVLLDNPDNDILWQLMEQYAREDRRVSIYQNEKNLGLVSSLNRLLGYVTEEYVARMDADDICYDNRFEQEMNFLEQHQLDFVMSGIDFIRGDIIEPGPEVPTLLLDLFAESEKYGNHATHPTWLLKKEVYEELNGYREVRYCEDLDFVLRAIQAEFRLGRMQEILLHYRMRETGISCSYAYEQYEKAAFLRQSYCVGKRIDEIVPDELNDRKDFSNEWKKKEFQETKASIDTFAALLYQRKYCSCLLRACKGIFGNKLYRQIFIDTVKNNRKMTKLFRKAREV